MSTVTSPDPPVGTDSDVGKELWYQSLDQVTLVHSQDSSPQLQGL